MDLLNFNNDGANHQAKAVLAFLQGRLGLEDADSERVSVSRWKNCREQGYVLCFRKNQKQ